MNTVHVLLMVLSIGDAAQPWAAFNKTKVYMAFATHEECETKKRSMEYAEGEESWACVETTPVKHVTNLGLVR